MTGSVILDHFRNPRNAGYIADADGVGIEQQNPWRISIQISLKIREGIVNDIKFKTQGCLTTIACASVMTDMVRGKSVEDALAVSSLRLSEALGTIPEEKLHCCSLAIRALHAAIDDYTVGRRRDSLPVGTG